MKIACHVKIIIRLKIFVIDITTQYALDVVHANKTNKCHQREHKMRIQSVTHVQLALSAISA